MASRLAVMAAALAAAVAASPAFAQSAKFPERPITLVVPFGAGTVDAVSRMIGDSMKGRLGQPVVVENKPGAFGNIGWTYMARQAPDGYTIAMISNSLIVNPHLYKMEIDVLKDIAPIARAADFYYALMVTKNLPVNTVKEFFDYAKAQKAPIHFGVASLSGQVSLAELTDATGVKFELVSYKNTADMSRAVVSGEVAAIFNNLAEAVRGASLVKLVGISSTQRVPQLPNVAAMAETFPNYSQVGWIGYGAPGGTPRAVVDVLNQAIIAAVNGDLKAKFVQMGLDPVAKHEPAAFAKFMAVDHERYGRIIKTYNIKAE